MHQLAPTAPNQTPEAGQSSVSGGTGSPATAMKEAQTKAETEEFASAAESLRQAMQDLPELAELSKQVLVDPTPDGLRIQLVDQEGRSMFDSGSAKPNDRARLLLRAVAKVVNQLHNRVTIAGHTSATVGATPERQGAGGKGPQNDWSLSEQRADAARVVLQDAGVDPDRFYQVSGKANAEPLYPDDPTLPGNRRITIVLMREKPVLPPDHAN
jgi:chemotaxis protein MotB